MSVGTRINVHLSELSTNASQMSQSFINLYCNVEKNTIQMNCKIYLFLQLNMLVNEQFSKKQKYNMVELLWDSSC